MRYNLLFTCIDLIVKNQRTKKKHESQKYPD